MPSDALGAEHQRNGAGERSATASLSTTGSTTTHYTRDDAGSLLGRRIGTERSYYLVDAVGSVRVMTDEAGTESARYSYEPFGKVTSATGPEAAANPWRFAGGYTDTVTGLTKFGTRYYDPAMGRWAQEDPLPGSVADPKRVNRYAYAGNDPVNRTDPSGLVRGGSGRRYCGCRRGGKHIVRIRLRWRVGCGVWCLRRHGRAIRCWQPGGGRLL